MSTIKSPDTSAISAISIFLIFLRLGLTSFGGPIAHLGYFRDEFVQRRHWLSDRSYADVVALCQFLPGPASSQVGLALGLSKGGYKGALAAWLGFTLPSALLMILFALGVSSYHEHLSSGLLHGLKIAAVAVVAHAVWGMGKSLCTGLPHITIMAISASVLLLFPTVWMQVGVIVMAGILGLFLFNPPSQAVEDDLPISLSRKQGFFWLTLFFILLISLPLLVQWIPNQGLAMFDAFYRSGALVFGGGHVVLPLLQAEVVPTGWVDNDVFLAGYGAAQAVPGPLFTFGAFLGASMNQEPSGCLGGLLALWAIFLPSFLLVFAALPFWAKLRSHKPMQAALIGVNAAVVGLLVAALYNPVWTSAIQLPIHFALALLAFVALMFWKQPAWLVVIVSGFLGWLVL